MYRVYILIFLAMQKFLSFDALGDDYYGMHIPSTFETLAEQAVLIDYHTGSILFSKNADLPMFPSSMSKLMTLYIAFQYLKAGAIKLTDEILISEKAWRLEGSRTFLNLNSRVKVEDLLRGIIVQSGNDASVALAEGIAGSEAAFAMIMNENAKKLGLISSTFVNATGWPDPRHQMSAIDLAKLSLAIVKEYPEYYHYFSEKEFIYNGIKQQNRNTLLGIGGVDGLKTGHTSSGGYGIVLSARKDNVRLISVVNGLLTAKDRINESERLLNYGFNNFQSKVFAKAGIPITTLPVWYGKQQHLQAVLKEDLKITLPRNIIMDRIVYTVEYTNPLTAPITNGQIVGVLNISYLSQNVKSVELYAHHSIHEANVVQKFWNNLKILLGVKPENAS